MGQRGYFLTRSKTSACPPALCNVSRSSETSNRSNVANES